MYFTDIMIHITHDKQVSGICSVSLHSLRISEDFISCVRFKLKWFLSLSVHEQHTNTTNDIPNKNEGKKNKQIKLQPPGAKLDEKKQDTSR